MTTTLTTNQETGLGLCIDAIRALEQYALDHYEEGGHWVAECFDVADYMQVLEDARGDLEEAKRLIKKNWERTCARERECAWDGPSDVGCEFDGKIY